MSIDKIQAVNEYVFVIKDDAITEIDGIKRPDHSSIKPNTGKIISVGGGVIDKNIRKDRTAIFAKSSGQPVDIFQTEITVLSQDKILGVYDSSTK